VRMLFRSRGFRLLMFGQTLSALGDRALIIAFGVWAKELTGSNAAAGVAFFFVAFPYLFAPAAGVVIDRFPRRNVYIVANLVMAAVLFACLLVDDAGDVWLLYAVTFCYGVSGIVIGPTQSTIISSIVDDADLPSANGLMQTITGGVRMLAPLVGAGLFTVIGGRAVAMIDAATFVVAALCVWGIRLPAGGRRAREPGAFRRETIDGLRHVFGAPTLRRVVVALGAALLVMGFSQTLIFSIVDEGLHRSPAFVGVLVSVQGAGTIAAGLLSGALTRRLGDVNVVVTGILSIGVAALLYLFPNVFVVAAGALWFGAATCWTTAGLITTVQLRTPEELKGRALATSMGAVSLPQTVSIALGAGLSLLVDYRVLLGAMAVVTAGAAAWLRWRSADDQLGRRRSRETEPEPATPSVPDPQTRTG
jgi:MFS family permease